MKAPFLRRPRPWSPFAMLLAAFFLLLMGAWAALGALDAQPTLAILDRYLAEAGRTRAAIGIEPRLNYGDGQPDRWQASITEWQAAGATHFSINTMGCGFATPAQHLAALRRFAELMF